MDWTNARVTTEVLWRGTLLFAPVDLLFLVLLARGVTAERFGEIRRLLPLTAGVFWFLIWLCLAAMVFWQAVYSYVFPVWSRWLLPPAQALLGAAVTLIAVRIAERVLRPVVAFCLLGGLWGSIAHVWAVYRGIMTKPPMLRGASPAAAVIFAFFEFTLYYCLITLGALVVRRLGGGRTG
jgi:hypothetical protein